LLLKRYFNEHKKIQLRKIIIIGGGLAGLISAIRLSRCGFNCTLIEKKNYPMHRVCGEYISNETIPFLKSEGLFPEILKPVAISKFQLTSVTGKSSKLDLDLGGFGVSRYNLDHFLYEIAKNEGVNFLLDTEVENIKFIDNYFIVKTNQQEMEAQLVIGSFGKRSKIDAQLHRSFFKKRSPYVGIKYHAKTNHQSNLIALHNFRGGYCGVSNVENGITNICYLTHRDNVKNFKSIKEMEEKVLWENPHLQNIFNEAEFLFDKPETINEVSFKTKEPVWNHVLMCGDAAGMIAPLCGNGMAMAIHSAKILTDTIKKYFHAEGLNRELLEHEYSSRWRKAFAWRLWVGRQLQNKLFGNPITSTIAVNLAIYSKPIAQFIIKKTHGDVF
jgi:flavin-dependent dehydrogenase